VVGLLVVMLMYGKQDAGAGRSAQVKMAGLLVSLVNLLVWAAITYWFFAHYAEMKTH